mmetsp:Transcript_13378/g.31392  ORF Transcript_13378/g.31392 Transcript_13378/m.31392 type:complete len:226 (+) Transcript_13378:862-1539(+)
MKTVVNKSIMAHSNVRMPAITPSSMRESSFICFILNTRNNRPRRVKRTMRKTEKIAVPLLHSQSVVTSTSMKPRDTNKLSKPFQYLSGPRMNQRVPRLYSFKISSIKKRIVNARCTQNHFADFSSSWNSLACQPIAAQFKMMTTLITGSIHSASLSTRGGCARSSTCTCVSSATKRFASPDVRISRTVSTMSCDLWSLNRAINSSSRSRSMLAKSLNESTCVPEE